jgi:hypothetical protein
MQGLFGAKIICGKDFPVEGLSDGRMSGGRSLGQVVDVADLAGLCLDKVFFFWWSDCSLNFCGFEMHTQLPRPAKTQEIGVVAMASPELTLLHLCYIGSAFMGIAKRDIAPPSCVYR